MICSSFLFFSCGTNVNLCSFTSRNVKSNVYNAPISIWVEEEREKRKTEEEKEKEEEEEEMDSGAPEEEKKRKIERCTRTD